MLRRIFPARIDNEYRGYKLAIWLLVLFLPVKAFANVTGMGLNPLWSNRDVLENVERVPLEAFSADAANAALVLFAWWHATNLTLTMLGVLALVRYRAIIPLIYLLTVLAQIGQLVIADASQLTGMLGTHASRPLIGVLVLLIGFGMSITTPLRLRSEA